MTVLVTGANGWVGGYLCRALAAQGQSFRAATRSAQPLARELQTWGQAITVPALHAQTDWSAALAGVSTVVHLAARVHMLRDPAADPWAAYREINVQASLQLARQAAQHGVQRLVFVSTAKVLGEETLPGRPFRADDPPRPQGPYAVSKHETEEGLLEIAAATGLELVIVRPPLVYGAGAKANFARLVQAVARGLPLPLGALHNQRSLVAVENLVDLLLVCLRHPAAAHQRFLVSDGVDLSTTELVQRIARSLHRPARLLPVPATLLMAGATLLGQRDVAHRLCSNLQLDITDTRQRLGWTPPLSVDEALARATAEWRKP